MAGIIEASDLPLSWNAPTNLPPNVTTVSYLVALGKHPGSYSKFGSTGSTATNCVIPAASLYIGRNYFGLMAQAVDTNGIIWTSTLSNEIVVTNSQALVLTTQSSYDLTNWTTWTAPTNGLIVPLAGNQFWRLKLNSTNQITIPPAP